MHQDSENFVKLNKRMTSLQVNQGDLRRTKAGMKSLQGMLGAASDSDDDSEPEKKRPALKRTGVKDQVKELEWDDMDDTSLDNYAKARKVYIYVYIVIFLCKQPCNATENLHFMFANTCLHDVAGSRHQPEQGVAVPADK